MKHYPKRIYAGRAPEIPRKQAKVNDEGDGDEKKGQQEEPERG
jgi:hypothetical protein